MDGGLVMGMVKTSPLAMGASGDIFIPSPLSDESKILALKNRPFKTAKKRVSPGFELQSSYQARASH